MTSERHKVMNPFRIHLMAGRIPVGSDRASVAKEMEETFVQNLNYAADVLSKAGDTFYSASQRLEMKCRTRSVYLSHKILSDAVQLMVFSLRQNLFHTHKICVWGT